ncbi:MAG TPA: hypothetical protein PK639_00735 [Candidatus Woesebacteria bacterium]|nr:hypothetical protein [Candidatus Woesebacteria bacterium]
MLKQKKIPTILGIFLLFISLIGGVYLTSQSTSFGSKASGECKPNNIQVTNITNHSANVSFLTSNNCLSILKIQNKNILDIRTKNTNSQPKAQKVHYFLLNDLSTNTKYQYDLIVGGKLYSSNEYQFTTGSSPSSDARDADLAWGRVFDQSKKPVANAIVFLNIVGAAPLSSYTTSNGNWNIPLQTSMNQTLTDWYSSSSKVDEDIVVIAQDGSVTQISSTTDKNNPVPNITLGENDFDTTSTSTQEAVIPTVTSFTTNYQLAITNPKEGESVKTLKPEFFGTAPKNQSVTIILGANTAQVVADSFGNWKWSPVNSLTPGPYSLSVKSGSSTLTRSFQIDNSQSSIAFTASSSATTPTKTPTLAPTLIPTSTPAPTAAPTTRVSYPSTTITPPVTGNTHLTFFGVLIGLLLLFLSMLLFR